MTRLLLLVMTAALVAMLPQVASADTKIQITEQSIRAVCEAAQEDMDAIQRRVDGHTDAAGWPESPKVVDAELEKAALAAKKAEAAGPLLILEADTSLGWSAAAAAKVSAPDLAALSKRYGEQACRSATDSAACLDHLVKWCAADATARTSGAAAPAAERQRAVEYIELQRTHEAGARSKGALVSEAWASAAIEGTAALIADRAQAELALWIVTDFKKQLCGLEDIDLPGGVKLDAKNWFPETCALVEKAGEQPSGMLASAFREDLEALPEQLLVALADATEVDVDELRVAAKKIRGLLKAVRDGASPLQEIAKFADDPDLTCGATRSPTCALKKAGAIAKHLPGVDLEALKSLDPGVLAEIAAGGSDLIADLGLPAMATGAELTRIESFLDKDDIDAVVRIIKAATALQSEIDKLPALASDQRRKQLFLKAVDIGAELFEWTCNDGRCGIEDAMVEPAAGALRHIAREEWQDAGRDTLKLLVKIAAKVDDACLDADGKAEGTKEEKKKCKQGAAVLRVTTRSLSFVIDAAEADTPEEFKAALDAASAPLGGWRLKYQRFTVSLGALAGAGVGTEFLLAATDQRDRALGVYTSPHAMLGVDFAGPVSVRGRRDKPWAMGGFVSVLDLGNVASFRVAGDVEDKDDLEDEEGDEEGAAETPNIGFAQVFSPGVFWRVSIARTPITFGLGLSASPNLRLYRREEDEGDSPDISDDGLFDARDSWVLRFGAFVAVDVTLLPFGKR